MFEYTLRPAHKPLITI
uniref:Uncharacterized protein n=1 Tax=Rhizophora mucronata TaxID=61149 RepID=A0A2P2P6G6_RHIMU